MATVGRALLILGLAISVYGIVASVYGARAGDRRFVDSGRRAVYALFGVVALAFVLLEAAFLRTDLSFALVAEHSSSALSTFYRATAMWSSQEGSLLLWLFLLAGWSSLALLLTRHRLRAIAPYATAVLLGFGAFFSFLVVFLASPFDTLANPPAQGAGLNPLLRHWAMMVHPPALYSGYTLIAVPFAFAIGALITRRAGAEWIGATRRFALGAWLALGVGILLGAMWSYTELGWGGYWAWDAVENAALLPWLTATAFIHSGMIQEKRGMLKVWNVSLVLATGVLAIIGTFLVRSGILSSIHAFVEPGALLRWLFVALIVAMIAGSVGLVLSRRAGLRSEHRLDSLLSREAFFLFQNVVLVGLAFVIFWGTFFPLISEAVTGTKSSVGPPWFSRYTGPLALALVALIGLGPLLAWRRQAPGSLRRLLAGPIAAGAVAAAVLALAVPVTREKPLALAMLALCAVVIAGVAQEFWRGARARAAMSGESPPVALVSVVRRNRRRYGGYVVHLGIAVLFIGVAASSAFQTVQEVVLRPGQRTRVEGYTFTYVRATTRLKADELSYGAVVDVRRGGRHVTTLRPAKGWYSSPDGSIAGGAIGRWFDGEPESDVGVKPGLRRDLWTAVEPDTSSIQPVVARADRRFAALMRRFGPLFAQATPAEQARIAGGIQSGVRTAVRRISARYVASAPPATFRILISPLIMWIWIGALVVFLGALVAIWPPPAAVRRRVPARYRARLARDLAARPES